MSSFIQVREKGAKKAKKMDIAQTKTDIYHAVDFTDYYLCTKFVVSCHQNLDFP